MWSRPNWSIGEAAPTRPSISWPERRGRELCLPLSSPSSWDRDVWPRTHPEGAGTRVLSLQWRQQMWEWQKQMNGCETSMGLTMILWAHHGLRRRRERSVGGGLDGAPGKNHSYSLNINKCLNNKKKTLTNILNCLFKHLYKKKYYTIYANYFRLTEYTYVHNYRLGTKRTQVQPSITRSHSLQIPFHLVYILHACPLELRQFFSSFVFFGLQRHPPARPSEPHCLSDNQSWGNHIFGAECLCKSFDGRGET